MNLQLFLPFSPALLVFESFLPPPSPTQAKVAQILTRVRVKPLYKGLAVCN